nr:hypothetical protein [Streptomyces sp. NBC_00243]
MRRTRAKRKQPQGSGVLTDDLQERAGNDGEFEQVPRVTEEVAGSVGVHAGKQDCLEGVEPYRAVVENDPWPGVGRCRADQLQQHG